MSVLLAMSRALCLTAAAAAAGAEGGPATRPATSGAAPAGMKQNLRRLRQEGLTPPETGTSAQLQEAIEALRRIRVVPRSRGRAAAGGASSARQAGPAVQPPATQPARRAAATQPAATTQPAGKAAPKLPSKVLEQLKGLPSAGLTRPIQLADELCGSGLLDAAYVLYEHALKTSQDPNMQSWVLYQMANCRRASDPTAAESLYGRVVTEHGRSVWAPAAAVERKLLQWHRVNDPLALLKSIASVGAVRTGRATSQPATTRPAATQPAAGPAGAKAVASAGGKK